MTTRLCGIPAPLSTVQLHASTSQSPLDIDQLFVKLEEPQLHILYTTELWMHCSDCLQNLQLHWSVAIATGREL